MRKKTVLQTYADTVAGLERKGYHVWGDIIIAPDETLVMNCTREDCSCLFVSVNEYQTIQLCKRQT